MGAFTYCPSQGETETVWLSNIVVLANDGRTCAKVHSPTQGGQRKADRRELWYGDGPIPTAGSILEENWLTWTSLDGEHHPLHGPLHGHVQLRFPLHGRLSACVDGTTWHRVAPVCLLDIQDHLPITNKGTIQRFCLLKDSSLSLLSLFP